MPAKSAKFLSASLLCSGLLVLLPGNASSEQTILVKPQVNVLARSSHLPHPRAAEKISDRPLQSKAQSSRLPSLSATNRVAQAPPTVPQNPLQPIIPGTLPPTPVAPSPLPLPSPLPPPDQLLQPTPPLPSQPQPMPGTPQTVRVQQFRVKDSTVFNADDLAALAWKAALSTTEIPELLQSYCAPTGPASTQEGAATGERCCPYTLRTEATQIPQQAVDLSFDQLLRARAAITQLYINCGFITSGAILPPQTPADEKDTVIIQVVEGGLETINVAGTRRLNPNYVRSRLAIATDAPLNRQRLLQALQLLQLNPLIQRISAELQAGTRPSTNILQVEVEEADSFSISLDLNNNRSPSVGTFERGISLTEGNLTGLGDSVTLGYTNTDGSNGVTANYRLPVNPRNGTVSLGFGYTRSNVTENPFDVLDISANSSFYELAFRQPLYQTPNTEFALGLTLSRQQSQTAVGFDNIGPFPLSPGADDEGNTRITAVRFTQDWLKRTPRQVIAARSQFSLGLNLFDATINREAPDSRFFAWRGQAQWVRQLDTVGTLFLARADMQLTPVSLVPLEQFGIGGMNSVRGYRQDALLTDNGVFGSLELQYPVLRSRQLGGKLFLVPFLTAGSGWNVRSPNPDPQTVVGTGIGLLWRQDNNNLSAQLYWGIPLVSIRNAREGTWQESGVYFSIVYSPF